MGRMNLPLLVSKFMYTMQIFKYCYAFLLVAVVLFSVQTVSASDKFGGGSSGGGSGKSGGGGKGGGGGYTSCGSGCSQGYNRDGNLETIRSGDYNGDGDYNDPNEVTSSVSRDSGGGIGGGRATSPAPCTTYPNLQVTDILFVVPGTSLTPARSNDASNSSYRVSPAVQAGAIAGVNQNNLTLGTQYEPVVQITNTGCTNTSTERGGATGAPTSGSDTSSAARTGSQTSTSGGGFINAINAAGSSVRNMFGGQLWRAFIGEVEAGGSGSSGRIATNNNQYHIDQLPFGQNGTFPVRLRIDFQNNNSYEITEYLNNQGPLPAGSRIYVRFPAVTMSEGGVHGINSTVDVTEAEAPGQACAGAEGCVMERGNPTTNTLAETFTVIVPSVQLGSYLLSGPTSGTSWFGRPSTVANYGTLDRRTTDRDLATDTNWNRQQGSTRYSNVGLYWTGTLINPATCTGVSVQNNGTSLSDFNGQNDIPRPAGATTVVISGFPGSGHNLDLQIIEPVASTSHTYTVTCQTTTGATVSDSILISNGLGGVPAVASLPNLQPESVTASGLAPATAEVRLRNTGTDIPSGTTFRTEYVLTSPLSASLNQTNAFSTTLTAPWRSNQVLSLPVRSLGTVSVNQYRVCVTANNTRSVVESNYNDNTLCANNGTSNTTPPQMVLEALGDVVRYNSVATLRYEIEASYIMQCTLTGPGVTRSFTHVSGRTENTVVTSAMQNKQQFVLSCTPDPAVGASFGAQTRTVDIEVIPQIQEV